jgi:release factor glutamine methyltransferase
LVCQATARVIILHMSEDEILLTHVLRCRPIDLLLNKPVLTDVQQKQFQEYKFRRQKGEPLQYILGSWDFYGLEFKVNPFVLVPRPETEMLVDLAIKRFQGTDILDIGTGSGNIAITLAKRLPYTKITAIDISIDALELALNNVQNHGVEARIELVHAGMEEYLSVCTQKYDLIISNPPYIPTSQINQLPTDVQHEPSLALDGGLDGLDFYRAIIKYSPGLLRKGAYLMMEFGDGQEQAITALASQKCSDIKIHKDLTGRPRVIICHF